MLWLLIRRGLFVRLETNLAAHGERKGRTQQTRLQESTNFATGSFFSFFNLTVSSYTDIVDQIVQTSKFTDAGTISTWQLIRKQNMKKVPPSPSMNALRSDAVHQFTARKYVTERTAEVQRVTTPA